MDEQMNLFHTKLINVRVAPLTKDCRIEFNKNKGETRSTQLLLLKQDNTSKLRCDSKHPDSRP